MESPCSLISGVNPFPLRFINITTFFCNAWIAWMRLLPAVWSKTILLSFLHFHWLFPLSARETSPGNRSICKSTRERVDSNGLYERWRLHLIGSWKKTVLAWISGWYPQGRGPGIQRSLPWITLHRSICQCCKSIVNSDAYLIEFIYVINLNLCESRDK